MAGLSRISEVTETRIKYLGDKKIKSSWFSVL